MFRNRIPFLYAGYHRFSHPQIKVRMSFNSPRRNNHVSTKHSTRTFNISMRVQITPTRLSKHVCAVVTLMQAEHRYFCPLSVFSIFSSLFYKWAQSAHICDLQSQVELVRHNSDPVFYHVQQQTTTTFIKLLPHSTCWKAPRARLAKATKFSLITGLCFDSLPTHFEVICIGWRTVDFCLTG